MNIGPTGWFRLARGSYLALLLLQPTWLYLLPPPLGPRSGILALVATLPLLLPLGGLWRGSLRAVTWAGYLSMLYLVIAATEAWANPPQRPPALIQAGLVAVYVAAALGFSRRPPAQQ